MTCTGSVAVAAALESTRTAGGSMDSGGAVDCPVSGGGKCATGEEECAAGEEECAGGEAMGDAPVSNAL
jgi:hypothetical protein